MSVKDTIDRFTTVPENLPEGYMVLNGQIISQHEGLKHLPTESRLIIGDTVTPLDVKTAEKILKAATVTRSTYGGDTVLTIPGRARNTAVAAITDGWIVTVRMASGSVSVAMYHPLQNIGQAAADLCQQMTDTSDRYSKYSPQVIAASASWDWDYDADALRFDSGDAVTEALVLGYPSTETTDSGESFVARQLHMARKQGGYSSPMSFNDWKAKVLENSPTAVQSAAVEASLRETKRNAALADYEALKDSQERVNLRQLVTNMQKAAQDRLDSVKATDYGSKLLSTSSWDYDRAMKRLLNARENVSKYEALIYHCGEILNGEGQFKSDGITVVFIEDAVEQVMASIHKTLLSTYDEDEHPVQLYVWHEMSKLATPTVTFHVSGF